MVVGRGVEVVGVGGGLLGGVAVEGGGGHVARGRGGCGGCGGVRRGPGGGGRQWRDLGAGGVIVGGGRSRRWRTRGEDGRPRGSGGCTCGREGARGLEGLRLHRTQDQPGWWRSLGAATKLGAGVYQWPGRLVITYRREELRYSYICSNICKLHIEL
ncbi:hypothetical protein J437_LFUL008664 [Ladona fulva]|uniref:Uncharacterized protein n=1 Tax=Ladona fulva TaxID=123851 RepID=A0A8K0K5E7_LADFU|nr:hypothetical protein J437_LFUL008664 [Ladona fulva]